MFHIILVIVMAHPTQLFGMTYPNGQTMVLSENPTNFELPPPYGVNEKDCISTTNEIAVV